MKAQNCRFTNLIEGSKQFIIPVFQRDYCWKSEQCDQMWNDVLRARERGHFIGSIIYVDADTGSATFQRWSLIDGQQRLTSLTLLLTALRDYIIETGWEGTVDSPAVNKINGNFLKNANEEGDRSYKLVLRRTDDTTLRALVDGNKPTERDGRVSQTIIDAYEYFKDRLHDPDCDLDAVYHGVNKLNIVEVTLQRDTDDPQLVFESTNSTGVDLNQSDLVRNYLLMGLRETKQTRLYDAYWSEVEAQFKASGEIFNSFLRDYIALQNIALQKKHVQQPRSNRIYDEFKSFRQQDVEKPLEDLLQDMVRVARSYASFHGLAPVLPEGLSDAMSNVRKLGTTQGLIIMRLYDLYENDCLSQGDFVRAVTLIESYILRRDVVGLSGRNYWTVFARVAQDMGSNFDSLRVALACLRDNNRFPDDHEFRRALEERDLYGLRNCKHILEGIENRGQREPSPTQNFSVEHIMPRAIANISEWREMLGDDWEEHHGTWLHRLGNLTLTAYNSTYSNRPFDEKKDISGGFRESPVRLNRYVAEQREWTVNEIEKRGEALAERALKIWPHHGADQTQLQEAEIRELRSRAAERTPDSLQMNDDVQRLLDAVLREVRKLDGVIEIVEFEYKSVCCHAPEFFVQLLPMKRQLRIILPLGLGEIEIPDGLSVNDASDWKFVPNRVYTDCDLLVDIDQESQVAAAMPIIRHAFDRQVL